MDRIWFIFQRLSSISSKNAGFSFSGLWVRRETTTIGTAEKYMPMEKMIIMEISSGGSMSMITYKRCS